MLVKLDHETPRIGVKIPKIFEVSPLRNLQTYLGVSKNRGTPKSSILIGFSIIFTIHFGVPVFLETPICKHDSVLLGKKNLRLGDIRRPLAKGERA